MNGLPILELAKVVGGWGLIALIFTYLGIQLKKHFFVDTHIEKLYLAQQTTIDGLKKRLDEKDEQLDKFQSERNEAVASLKKWEYIAETLQAEVQDLKAQLRRSEESNNHLRAYVYGVMQSIHSFSKKHPDMMQDLDLPSYDPE